MPIRTFLRKFARACRYRADAADQPQRGKIAHCDRYQSSLRGLLAVMPKFRPALHPSRYAAVASNRERLRQSFVPVLTIFTAHASVTAPWSWRASHHSERCGFCKLRSKPPVRSQYRADRPLIPRLVWEIARATLEARLESDLRCAGKIRIIRNCQNRLYFEVAARGRRGGRRDAVEPSLADAHEQRDGPILTRHIGC